MSLKFNSHNNGNKEFGYQSKYFSMNNMKFDYKLDNNDTILDIIYKFILIPSLSKYFVELKKMLIPIYSIRYRMLSLQCNVKYEIIRFLIYFVIFYITPSELIIHCNSELSSMKIILISGNLKKKYTVAVLATILVYTTSNKGKLKWREQKTKPVVCYK